MLSGDACASWPRTAPSAPRTGKGGMLPFSNTLKPVARISVSIGRSRPSSVTMDVSVMRAMGVVINQPVADLQLKEIFDQLEIDFHASIRNLPIHFGGPVESHRGFVLHTSEHGDSESVISKDGIALSTSLAVLQQLAQGTQDSQGMLMLGYAGWSPGQLESEIEGGSWLVVPASKELIFDTANDTKWNVAVSALGFDMGHFSSQVGHA